MKKNKFKVGDKVRVKDKTRYSIQNGYGEYGVIISFDTGEYTYQVKWREDTILFYDNEDLILYKPPIPVVNTFEELLSKLNTHD